MTDPGNIAVAVARAIRGLRADHGWSLDHLAGRSGVSKGVLVALEQGRSNPSLSTLARISDAFGVPATRLLEVTGEAMVRITGPDRSPTLWHGPSGGTGTLVAATDPPWAAELWRWDLAPGEGFGGDAHAPATREMSHVDEGTLTLTVAGERHEILASHTVRFAGDRPHSYANETSDRLRLTMIVVVPPADAGAPG